MENNQIASYFERFKIKAQIQSNEINQQTLIIDKELDQFIKFARLMKQMGYTSSLPLSGEDVYKLAISKNSPLKNWKFTNPDGQSIILNIQEDQVLSGELFISPTKLISLKVPEDLLIEFKKKAQKKGHRYQTLIKQLMFEWLQKNS